MPKHNPLTIKEIKEYKTIFKCPEHWTFETAQFAFNEVRDGTHDSPKKTEEGYPLVTSKNIKNGKIDLSTANFISEADHAEISKRSKVQLNDILFSMIGTIGNTCLITEEPDFSIKNVALFRENNQTVHPIFGCYWLKSDTYQKFLESKKRGGNQKFLSLGVLRDSPVIIPPLEEQKRIADKLDSVLAKVEAAQARLDKIPTILKRFRQSVLAAATSGELTKDWREENETNDVSPFVESIQNSKEGKLKVRTKKGWDKDLNLYDLPTNWAWISNHKLAEDNSSAICAGPFGTIFKAKDFRDLGVPIIFLRHVKENGFNQNKPNFMDEEVWQELHQEYSVFGGELSVTKLGDPPGEACIYPKDAGTAMVTPDVLKMSVDSRVALTEYLQAFFNSPNCKDMVRDLAFGATRLRIDIAMFKNFPIPLPPLDEQMEIVSKVGELFEHANTVEKQYKNAKARLDKLTQSILAKAFRGELIK